jgi:hypothetical protein
LEKEWFEFPTHNPFMDANCFSSIMPKILDEKSRGISDEEQKFLALLSESGIGANNPVSSRENRSEFGDDLVNGLVENKSGFLGKTRELKRRFW